MIHEDLEPDLNIPFFNIPSRLPLANTSIFGNSTLTVIRDTTLGGVVFSSPPPLYQDMPPLKNTVRIHNTFWIDPCGLKLHEIPKHQIQLYQRDIQLSTHQLFKKTANQLSKHLFPPTPQPSMPSPSPPPVLNALFLEVYQHDLAPSSLLL